MPTKLAPHQISQEVYDETNSAIRTTIQNMEIAIELSADDGDNVEARHLLLASKTLVSSGIATGTVIATVDIKQLSDLLVGANVVTTVTASALKIQIELSPSDTDDVWHHDNTFDVTVPSNGFTHIKNSSIGPWRRARAKAVFTTFSAGSFNLYLNGRS
jgi:hypothetical protein